MNVPELLLQLFWPSGFMKRKIESTLIGLCSHRRQLVQLHISAKIIMPKTADPYRINKCRSLGAEVILTENVDEAFKRLGEVEREEGRYILHPFNSENMILGSATCCAHWQFLKPPESPRRPAAS